MGKGYIENMFDNKSQKNIQIHLINFLFMEKAHTLMVLSVLAQTLRLGKGNKVQATIWMPMLVAITSVQCSNGQFLLLNLWFHLILTGRNTHILNTYEKQKDNKVRL